MVFIHVGLLASPVRAVACARTLIGNKVNSSETLGYWSLVSRTVINHCVAELAVLCVRTVNSRYLFYGPCVHTVNNTMLNEVLRIVSLGGL